MNAVQFDQYGGIEVLHLAEVPVPEAGPGQALIRVKAASINPFEAKLRAGAYRSQIPVHFPSGQGTDLAGVVTKLGSDAHGITTGDEVIGFSKKRGSQAEYVVAQAQNLTPKPAKVSWEAGGSLSTAGSAAYASVRAVSLKPGDTVAVSAASGGVGSIAVQLAKRTGATVIGIASPASHGWLDRHGIKPVAYGADLPNRLREAGVNALIDAHGAGYVKLAIELGVTPQRINTLVDFTAAKEYGAKTDGSEAVKSAGMLAELAALVASGDLEIPIAATFPLSEVRAAFTLLEQGHAKGKIVLLP